MTGGLSGAVEAAINAATWLKPADNATVALAKEYADYFDQTVVDGDPLMIQKAISVVGPNLQKTLHSLGLTPEARGELVAKGELKESAADELAKLRSRRQRKASG